MDEQLEALPRNLDYIESPVPNEDIGPPGELQWIRLDELFIDRQYQRHVLERGKRNIKAMVQEFSWALFGALVIGRRGLTRYAVIDGQHRAIAAALRGDIAKVPCIVLQGGQQQEARAFSAINSNVTRIHPLQAFRASVVAGDHDSLATVRVVEAAGAKISPYPKQELGEGETQSLAVIRQLVRNYGPRFTTLVLRFLRTLDPNTGLSQVAIQGAARVLNEHEEWLPRLDELAAKVARGRAGQVTAIEREAKERKVLYGGTIWLNFASLLENRIKAGDHAVRFMDEGGRQRAMGSR